MKKNDFLNLLNSKHEKSDLLEKEGIVTPARKPNAFRKPLLIATPVVSALAAVAIIVPLAIHANAPKPSVQAPEQSVTKQSSSITPTISSPATPEASSPTDDTGTNELMQKNALNSPQKPFNSNEIEPLSATYIDALQAFTVDFSKQVYVEDKNPIYSPLSIATAFAMLKDGTGGSSKEELETLFHNGVDKQQTQNMLLGSALDKQYNEAPCYLDIAQSIFIDSSFQDIVKQSYVDLLTDYYYAEAFTGSLKSDVMHDALAEWINGKTNDFLDKKGEDFKELEGLFWLVNTVYLKTNWLAETYNRGDLEFHNLDGSVSTRNFFRLAGNIRAYEGPHYVAASIGMYGKICFNILMPKEGEDAASWLTADESHENLHAIATRDTLQGGLTEIDDIGKEPQLFLPEFDAHGAYNLSKILPELGVTSIFDPDLADLSGIADMGPTGGNLYISTAIHEAGIDVNQDGIEAAAFTLIGGDETAAAIEYFDVRYDRPFLYSVTNQQGLPLFVGAVNAL